MAQDPEFRRLVRLASGYNRKARQYGVKGTIRGEDLYLIEAQSSVCHYCSISLEWGSGTFDHVIPLDRGGQNVWFNIVRCCITCQRNKFTKTPGEFMAHRELLVKCEVCGKEFQPRWSEYQRGMARVCSRSCAARKRWT